MKKYKIRYWDEDKSKPLDLIQWSKSGKWHGVTIIFYIDGTKDCQDNWKNDFADGLEKIWSSGSKNRCFQNWKKHRVQGINISFRL